MQPFFFFLHEFRPDSKPVSADTFQIDANPKMGKKKKKWLAMDARLAASTTAHHIRACQVQRLWSHTSAS